MPPQDRDEDSGLHDIRNLASSTKMRLSSRRTSTSPPVDEDILASSSAGWKAVALPEPAKMVSLPALEELPPVEQVKADRKSKKDLKAERTSASKIASAAIAVETSPVTTASPAVAKPVEAAPAAASAPVIGGRFAQPAKKSKTGLYAGIGLGLAAAAGVGWYVSTQMKSNTAAPQVAAVEESPQAVRAPAAAPAPAPTPTPTVEPIAPPPAPADQPADGAVATGMAAAQAAEDSKADDAKAKGKAPAKAERHEKKAQDKAEVAKAPEAKPEAPKAPTGEVKKTEGGEGEPSFDALLKEAGVQEKKAAKPVLDKKSLSGADIKKGMGGVGAKAQACYQGTQGTAQVKLTVTPDGKVEKVTVTGVFAGTPVGECVEAAVKSAAFPPWDGGPQSFGYSYLLAE